MKLNDITYDEFKSSHETDWNAMKLKDIEWNWLTPHGIVYHRMDIKRAINGIVWNQMKLYVIDCNECNY